MNYPKEFEKHDNSLDKEYSQCKFCGFGVKKSDSVCPFCNHDPKKNPLKIDKEIK